MIIQWSKLFAGESMAQDVHLHPAWLTNLLRNSSFSDGDETGVKYVRHLLTTKNGVKHVHQKFFFDQRQQQSSCMVVDGDCYTSEILQTVPHQLPSANHSLHPMDSTVDKPFIEHSPPTMSMLVMITNILLTIDIDRPPSTVNQPSLTTNQRALTVNKAWFHHYPTIIGLP